MNQSQRDKLGQMLIALCVSNSNLFAAVSKAPKTSAISTKVHAAHAVQNDAIRDIFAFFEEVTK